MDRTAEGLSDGIGYFSADTLGPSGLQSILKKVPVSSIFPNASRRGRKANAPRKRTHPVSIGLNSSQGQDYGGEATSLPSGVLDLAGAGPVILPDGPASKKTRRTSERSQQRKAAMKPKARTARNRKDMSEKILNLTMEIISVLAGEECTVVTKSGEPVVPGKYPLVPGGPVSASVAQTLKQERQSDQKILDLTFRIIQLLTGEGPGGKDDATSSHVGKGKNKSPHRSVIVERGRPSTSRGALLAEEAISEDANVYRATDHMDKVDLPSHEVGMITESGTYVQTVNTAFKDRSLKEESGREDNMRDPKSVPFTTIRVKEESTLCEEGTITDDTQFLSIKIKEESVSEDEGNLGYTEPYSASRYKKRCNTTSNYHAEDTDSGEDDNDSNMYTPADYEQYPSTHTEPPPMLFPNSGGPMDFLGFDDNSNLDTDVNALIKHAHTKFSFAPIEGGSGSEEDDPLPEPEIQPPPKDDGAQKAAPNTEESYSGEEGTSEEAAVSSTKKDRTLKTYTCSECQECFVRRSDFANHRRDHRRERLTCPECGKVFANKPSLLNHLTGHTGEKPYSCSVCGKCFTRNSNLIVHQATHIERSPFTALNVTDMLVKQIL